MTVIRIQYTGDICPVNQKYVGRNFTLSNRYRAFKTALGYKAKESYNGNLLSGNLCVYIKFYYPKVMDIDAPIKCVLDSLNDIIWEDDKQIQELFVRKKKGKEYMLDIKVVEMRDDRV